MSGACGTEAPVGPSSAAASPTPACPAAAAPEPVTPAPAWSWQAINTPSLQTLSVAVDPEDERTVYTSGSFGLYASDDGGATWRRPLTDAVTSGIAFLPESSCTVFVAAGRQLKRSDDRGRHWRFVRTFPDSLCSVHVGRDSRHLFVGPQVDPRYSQTADGIWVSSDLGATWSLSPLPTVSRGLIPWHIAEDLSGVLYTGTEIWDHPQPYRPPYYRSLDRGRTWEDVTGPLPWHVIKTEAHPAGVRVWALTEGAGLYVTDDQAAHWSRLGRSFYALDLLVDPRAPDTLYAAEATIYGRPGGAFASTDGGLTFHGIGLEGLVVGSLALNGTSSRLYAASYQSGLFRATVPLNP